MGDAFFSLLAAEVVFRFFTRKLVFIRETRSSSRYIFKKKFRSKLTNLTWLAFEKEMPRRSHPNRLILALVSFQFPPSLCVFAQSIFLSCRGLDTGKSNFPLYHLVPPLPLVTKSELVTGPNNPLVPCGWLFLFPAYWSLACDAGLYGSFTAAGGCPFPCLNLDANYLICFCVCFWAFFSPVACFSAADRS
jgi:hypothetical protein